MRYVLVMLGSLVGLVIVAWLHLLFDSFSKTYGRNDDNRYRSNHSHNTHHILRSYKMLPQKSRMILRCQAILQNNIFIFP